MKIRILTIGVTEQIQGIYKDLLHQNSIVASYDFIYKDQDIIMNSSMYYPDLIIFDVTSYGSKGLQTFQSIKDRYKESKILVISFNTEKQYINKMFEIGADGFLEKNYLYTRLNQAIDVIIKEGQKYFNRESSSEFQHQNPIDRNFS